MNKEEMSKKDLEKLLKNVLKTNAKIISLKDGKNYMIKVEGKTFDILYLFTELVKALNVKTDTDMLKFAFEIGLEDK